MNVGVSSNLLSYGLTSINSIQLALMLAERFKAEVPVQLLLKGASIVDIENTIFEEWQEHEFFTASTQLEGAGTEGKTQAALKDYYPLSSVQLRVYYDAMKRPDDIIYNVPLYLAFEKIDAARLTEAVKKTVATHPYINTHIEAKDGELVQVRNDSHIPEVGYREMAEQDFASYKAGFLRSFNLLIGPLYHFEIVKTEKRTYFLMGIHHIIFDGMSEGIFLKDLGRADSGQELTPESYNYFDYSDDEEKARGSASYTDAEEYFAAMFSRYETPSEISADKTGVIEEGHFGEAAVHLGKGSVNALCSRMNVTPASFFLSALFATVSRFANTKDVYISTIDSGRTSLKTMKNLGMFVHTLPLSMDLKQDMTSEELVLKSNEVLRGSVANEIFPFTQIAAKYGYQTNIMYECQLGVAPEANMGGVPFENVDIALEIPKFKVAVVIHEDKDSYIVRVRYNDAIYTENYMRTLAVSLKNIAESFINAPDAKVSAVSLMGNAGKKLIESFRTSAEYEIPCRLLHKMFEACAEAHPEKTALIACDKALTFTELNESANIIAYNLMKKGLKA